MLAAMPEDRDVPVYGCRHDVPTMMTLAWRISSCVLLASALVPVEPGILRAGQDSPIAPEGWSPHPARLTVNNELAGGKKELSVETGEWKVIFSLFYNGGIYRMFDKVHDPGEQDNLVTGPVYCQGGIFDYDVYLRGDQEFSTAIGRNDDPGHATLGVLENTPTRLRLRQVCHPRLNNGKGPPGNPFIELDMVTATTDWTFYPDGRVNIKFDAVYRDGWNGIIGGSPGGSGPGVNANGATLTATNGASFHFPWVTQGDMIESKSGGWGPIEVAERINEHTLRMRREIPAGANLDFTITRPFILDETISIHADGDPGEEPRTSRWQGGSSGVPVFRNGTVGDLFRGNTPPLTNDYMLAHWTRPPRGFGTLLAFYEPFERASYAVFNDQSYRDISYTQVARRGWRKFAEHHRHFMARLGTEQGQVLPRIKSVADGLPFADDYRSPFAEARAGKLDTGTGISVHGFHVSTGAYQIEANESGTAEIAFDAMRGGSVSKPLAYFQPAILISNLDVPDDRIRLEISQDNGATFHPLPPGWYNLTTRAESSELGGAGRRLVQLLCPVPATATGDLRWVLRASKPAVRGAG